MSRRTVARRILCTARDCKTPKGLKRATMSAEDREGRRRSMESCTAAKGPGVEESTAFSWRERLFIAIVIVGRLFVSLSCFLRYTAFFGRQPALIFSLGDQGYVR